MTRTFGVAALLLIALVPAHAEEKRKSLTEARQEVIKGTSPGIVILDFGAARSASAPAPANASASASAPAAARPVGAAVAGGAGRAVADPAANDASKQGTRTGWWLKLPAPSGRPLSAARRLDAPDQGIALPTAASASRPASAVEASPSPAVQQRGGG